MKRKYFQFMRKPPMMIFFREMTQTSVKIKALRTTLLDHEKYFNASEVSMAKAILNWLPYHQKSADTLNFFKHLRARDLKSHKVHARFALTVFEMVGARYEEL